MYFERGSFNSFLLSHWDGLAKKVRANVPVVVDGHQLDLATVIVVAR
jgi:hypothetical protein